MKRNFRIKALLVIAILWIVGIFIGQLYTLPQIREQVSAGLRTGLQEISGDVARRLSTTFESSLNEELLSLKPSSPFTSDSFEEIGQSWSRIVDTLKITHLWALAIPDSSKQTWQVHTYISSNAQKAANWRFDPPLSKTINRRLPQVYEHWTEDAKGFWIRSVDSTLLLYDKESHFSDTKSFACRPIFDPLSKELTAFICAEIISPLRMTSFFDNFFDSYFSIEEKKRKDGIRKEFLHIRIRDESGGIIYRSSILANSKMEAKVPISQVSPYLGLFQLELGFIGKDADGVANSLYQKNLWIIGGVFGVLLLLMGALYYTSLKSQKLDRLKSEFLANMGHELKTPLSAIKLANDTLRLGRTESPEQAALSTEIIHKESDKLERLIRNLMEYSRMELGGRRYKKEAVDVKNWWGDWLLHSKKKLNKQGFSLTIRTTEISGKVFMDKSALEEVLDILLDNAVKYSPDTNELKIFLTEEAERIQIQVEDQGIGIPKERHADIFEKFVRLDNLEIHDVKGYGLGLSIAKAIVEAHEGEIEVDSVPGKGSIFSVSLPKSP